MQTLKAPNPWFLGWLIVSFLMMVFYCLAGRPATTTADKELPVQLETQSPEPPHGLYQQGSHLES